MSLSTENVFKKNILLRADLNVPVVHGIIADKARILALEPTIRFLLKQQCKIIILSHFGRPKASLDKNDWQTKDSLQFLTVVLMETFQCPTTFVNDCVGETVQKAIEEMPYGSLLLLENVRFYLGETSNDLDFSRSLSAYADIYVNEAFSCDHRAHASTVGVTQHLPSFPGFALQHEIKTLEQHLGIHKKRPYMAIVGGSKVSTKFDILNELAPHVDQLFITGAMANTFLASLGYHLGKSLIEPDFMEAAKALYSRFSDKIQLPIDARVAESLQTATPPQVMAITDIPETHLIGDIGPATEQLIKRHLESTATVVWNGTPGAYEYPPFDQGSYFIARLLAGKADTITIAGGGDTLAILEKENLKTKLTHVSTAGGAFLEWLAGKKLPGLVALGLQ